MQTKLHLPKLQIRPTTRAFLNEARSTPNMGIVEILHAYIYGRWPYLCISLGTGEHRLLRSIKPIVNFVIRILFRFPSSHPQFGAGGLKPVEWRGRKLSRRVTFADTYHAKVVRSDSAKKIVSANRSLRLTDLEHVVPYALARDLVLEESNRILLLECPCRASRTDPCLPVDVCLVMGDPFVGFVADHHPEKSRWIERAEAIDILSAEAGRGHVHHAFFKEATLGRFYAICNCCDCCCGAIQAHRNGVPMLASSGYLCSVDDAKCELCGICEQKCPFGAIGLTAAHVQINTQICMGCGVCAGFCQQDALSLVRDHSRSAPLELDQLLERQRQL